MSTKRPWVASRHETSGPGITRLARASTWVAKRLPGLLRRWFCPREAVAVRREWPGPAPPRRPPYLFTTLSDGGRELTDYHIHTLDTGLFELLHLLFHCGFKSEVRCEETCPAPGKEEGTGGGATTGRRVGREEEGSLSRAGPGSGVEDGTGMGGERETPTWRKRERTEDNVSVGPGPPYRPPGLASPGCCPRPPGLCEWGGGASAGPSPC